MIVAAACSARDSTYGVGVSLDFFRVHSIEDGRIAAMGVCLTLFPVGAGWREHKVSVGAVPPEWLTHPEPEAEL
jgi:hypothetical protein